MLTRLVQLNRERRAKEQAGTVHYLRPAFQTPKSTQGGLSLGTVVPARPVKAEPRPWPARLPEQMTAVLQVIKALTAADAKTVASSFNGAGPKTVEPILESLAGLSQIREVEPGVYAS